MIVGLAMFYKRAYFMGIGMAVEKIVGFYEGNLNDINHILGKG